MAVFYPDVVSGATDVSLNRGEITGSPVTLQISLVNMLAFFGVKVSEIKQCPKQQRKKILQCFLSFIDFTLHIAYTPGAVQSNPKKTLLFYPIFLV